MLCPACSVILYERVALFIQSADNGYPQIHFSMLILLLIMHKVILLIDKSILLIMAQHIYRLKMRGIL